MKTNDSKNKKEVKIFGISIWRILAYFIIYSIFGYIIETLYGAVTKGVIESRQSFLYGPFCAIYGLGACIMIIGLQKFKKSHNYQFLGGFIIGSIVEYAASFFGEMILHVKWWDYSNLPFNIHGRVCIAFSFFWGVLAIYLMGSLNPKIDKLIDKITAKIQSKYSRRTVKTLTIATIIFMLVDCIVTGMAIRFYQIRKIEEYNLNVDKKELVSEAYNEIYGNEKLADFIHKYWNDEKMVKTFPNLKIQDKEGEIVFFKDLVPNVKPYYFKIYDK